MAFKINFCPQCGSPWDAWEPDALKCWACGFDREAITRMGEPKVESIPESCPDHPKYKSVGKPTTDCPTCWKMYKAAIDKQADEVINK